MAIIAGMNLVDQPWFDRINTIGTGWTHVDQLTTAPLQPAARYPAQSGVVGVEWWAAGTPPVMPNCFALLGTDVGLDDNGVSRPSLVLEAWTFLGGWVGVPYTLFELAAPGSPRHLVVVPEFVTPLPSRWRLRWQANGRAGFVGSTYCGRYIQDPELADAGWRMRYVDGAQRDRSADGQVFTGSTSIRRELRIEQGVLDSRGAFSVPGHGEHLTLGAPEIEGSVLQLDGWLQVGATIADGSARWPGVLAEGAWYRMDYETSHTGEPLATPRWDLGVVSWEWRSADLGIQRGSVMFLAATPSFGAPPLELFASPGAGTSRIRITALSRIEPLADSPEVIELRFNLQWLHATHGASRPIIAMPYPNDPALNAVTGLYGYIQSPVDFADRAEGRILQSAMVIEEQR